MEVKVPKNPVAFSFLHPLRRRIVKYALMPSESEQLKSYAVIERKNLFGHYFSCNCPDYFFRQHECKHIRTFKGQNRTVTESVQTQV